MQIKKLGLDSADIGRRTYDYLMSVCVYISLIRFSPVQMSYVCRWPPPQKKIKEYKET